MAVMDCAAATTSGNTSIGICYMYVCVTEIKKENIESVMIG